jgi:hypothetical protein
MTTSEIILYIAIFLTCIISISIITAVILQYYAIIHSLGSAITFLSLSSAFLPMIMILLNSDLGLHKIYPEATFVIFFSFANFLFSLYITEIVSHYVYDKHNQLDIVNHLVSEKHVTSCEFILPKNFSQEEIEVSNEQKECDICCTTINTGHINFSDTLIGRDYIEKNISKEQKENILERFKTCNSCLEKIIRQDKNTAKCPATRTDLKGQYIHKFNIDGKYLGKTIAIR